ncbi:MAG: hypothetical protein IJW99_12330 [Clostridia bacterium]|nr:hypothetical protein [Clostridia bacterium]
MKTKQKIVEHNGRRYEVQWQQYNGGAEVMVNGVKCSEMNVCKDSVFAIVPNSENRLLTVIYRNKVYIFDVDPSKDMEFYNRKYTYFVSLPMQLHIIATTGFPFLWYAGILKEFYPSPTLVTPTIIFAGILAALKIIYVITFHPKLKHRNLFLYIAHVLIAGISTVLLLPFLM